MPTFTYTAKNRDGRRVSGRVIAPNQAVVLKTLHKQELIVLNVRNLGEARGRSKKVKEEDLVGFSRQLATLVEAGIPLVGSLDTLQEQLDHPALKAIVAKVRDDVEGGANFTEALAKHPTAFSPLFINLVRAGEASGTLAEILDRLAGYLEKTAELRRKVKSALIYPALVSGMALVITLGLLLKVVPTFKEIFTTLGGELPLPTKILLAVSDGLRHYFIVFLLAVGALVFLFRQYVRTPVGQFQRDRLLLRLPIFGDLIRKVAIARFARTLTTLIKSGVPILTSLEIVGKTAGSKVIERAVQEVRSSIREGENIAGPLEHSQVFPPMVVRMVGVGEQTGQLEKMLTKIADFYESEVDAAVSGLTSIIEPLIIAFLGIVVGSIVISIFLPIFKMTTLVGK